MSRISHQERERIKRVAAKMIVEPRVVEAHSLHRLVSLRLTLKELKLVRTEMEANVANCDDPELNAEYKGIFKKCHALLIRAG